MKVPTNHAVLLDAVALFLPLNKLKLAHGNKSNTVCELFTAGGHLMVKTNTGDFKGPADGEIWPPVSLTMGQVKQLAKLYCRFKEPLNFERTSKALRVGSTVVPLIEA